MGVNIIEHNWSWNGALMRRVTTDAIVLHHAAAVSASAEDIDRIHKGNGWSGIGYHYYVRKNGEVHRGRPEWAIGAHVLDHNSHTIGVCAEGNYETETDMPAAQLAALRALVADLRTRYPAAQVKRHSDYMATACPGQYYPFDEITAEYEEEEDMVRYNSVAEMPQWYQKEAQALIDAGALCGDGAGKLNVTEDMLRCMIIGKRYMDALLDGADTKPSGWAAEELAEAVAAGITDGQRPRGYATREEAAIMVKRASYGHIDELGG